MSGNIAVIDTMSDDIQSTSDTADIPLGCIAVLVTLSATDDIEAQRGVGHVDIYALAAFNRLQSLFPHALLLPSAACCISLSTTVLKSRSRRCRVGRRRTVVLTVTGSQEWNENEE